MFVMANIAKLAAGGVVLRLVLLVYGEWQDSTMAVKFTDVDYHVFTDAARYMTEVRYISHLCRDVDSRLLIYY